jgi:hypothetical protein
MLSGDLIGPDAASVPIGAVRGTSVCVGAIVGMPTAPDASGAGVPLSELQPARAKLSKPAIELRLRHVSDAGRSAHEAALSVLG